LTLQIVLRRQNIVYSGKPKDVKNYLYSSSSIIDNYNYTFYIFLICFYIVEDTIFYSKVYCPTWYKSYVTPKVWTQFEHIDQVLNRDKTI